MIDIHSHIIFGVDDGPKTLEDSLSLLAEASQQGVTKVVATSHRRKGMFETPESTILNHFTQVKEAASQEFPDLELYYGGELYYTPSVLEKLEQGHFPTLNGSRFALIEFSGHTPYKEIYQAVSELSLLGVTPVLAHIERYQALENDEKRVRDLISMGAYTQINSSSVLKPKLFGDQHKVYKKRARYFLDRNLVHCVASDMHNLDGRKPYMAEAYRLIEATYGRQEAQRLFVINPQSLLNNTYI